MKQQNTQAARKQDALRQFEQPRESCNERLMQLLRRDVTEAKADEDAERDAQRYHAARAFILQKQIDALTAQAVSHRPKQSPMMAY
jgi:hypothetical protein